jgi:CheY-like chemotaxis protein
MSGYGFAQAARADGALGKACLVAVSGWEGTDHEQQAYAAGFDQVLRKPVGITDLEQILRSPPRRISD